jgi:3-oxoacyl-[acyl-carrier-protein] synthase-3
VSLPNYLEVADGALEASDCDREDLDFVAVTHMKHSFHDTLVEELGLDPERESYYLDDYGHMQSVDQIVALDEGRQRDRIEAGDLVLFLAAGTGYTWSAIVVEWEG